MRRTTLMIAMALLVAACGGPSVSDEVAEKVAENLIEDATGGQVDIETSEEGEIRFTVEDDEGAAVQVGAGSLPDDFPFPLPDEYTVGMNVRKDGSAGTEFLAVIQVPGEDIDAMAEMYASWLDSQGFEMVDRYEVQVPDGAKLVFMAAQRPSDDVIANVDLSLEEIANDDAGNPVYATVISLSWMPNPG